MAEARQRAAWGRTASLMALIAEVNRDRKRRGRPFRPADFDPYAPPARVALTADRIEELKALL